MEPMEVAQSVVAAYAREGDVACAIVAGSLGRGDADRYSDIEIDIFWATTPTDDRRHSAVEAAGGDLKNFWPYEPDEGEWSEDFGIDDHSVTISGFSVGWMEKTIAGCGSFDLLSQLRMAALHEGLPLFGDDLVQRWRGLSDYPDELAANTIDHYLAAAPLHSWRQWPALVDRQDSVLLHDLCTQLISSMLGMLCGINHVYVSHPRFKWATRTIQCFSLAPEDLLGRVIAAFDAPVADLTKVINALYGETLIIAQSVHPSDELSDAVASMQNDPT